MQKAEFWEEEMNGIAGDQGSENTAGALTDIRILMMKLLALFREYASHPHGGDPRAIDAGHENERKSRLARQTELAFILIAALTGGFFLWLAVSISLPWWLVLPILIALWLAFSWALTYALRNGLVLILNVTPHNQKAERYGRFIFGVSFIGFLIFLVAFTMSRFMAVGTPELLGLEQTLVEVFALLCAASAGALREYYLPICELVTEIRDTMRQITSLRAKLESLNRDVDNVDRLLSRLVPNSLNGSNNTPGVANQNASPNGQQGLIQPTA